jgi:alanyl-tRNA synthetase
MKNVNDIRSIFLDFFKHKGHEIRPSSSLVPQNDPTLMFANAGMNQFKNVFTGMEKLPYGRAATSQKVVRAGGKHNDLDNVGYTVRHHTFFEMLGNFSFGDYFKEGAISYAWELLTSKDYYGLDKDCLTFTVYHTDDEAFNLWKKITGCDDRRILRIPTKDNFWAMGDTGPCGPCSEIFYDHKTGNGEWALNPDGSDKFDERFVEIWNLVFMQYEQVTPEQRVDLPKPSIDTGMGLERIAAVMQGVHDNYDIDLFKSLITDIKSQAAQLGAKPAKESAPYKVLADHLRSSCFLIADGVLPSNEGRGYVLRRIMRRGMRYAHQLGCKDPLMYRLVPALVKEMGVQYPELARAEASITDNLRQEEERFKQTLERGLKLLEEESAPLSKGQKLSGDAAFKLYDTYGFPLDLTQDILRARGIEVDTDTFEKCMDGQRDMARAAHKGSGDVATSKVWFELKNTIKPTQFTGYDEDKSEGKVLAIVKNGEAVSSANEGDAVFIILDKTPFYGESGGQVGDTGTFTRNGMVTAEITDTLKPTESFHAHEAKLKFPLQVGDTVFAAINVGLRNQTRANHSATHLLHKALRDALGDHVTQKGSLVSPERLRFDISHPKAVSKEEIAAAERKVNEVVARDTAVDCKEMAPDDAIKAGAMALFGEKYGDKVRVLTMGVDNGKPYSVELCGGTHVRRTGDISLFKITSEGSVASGVRRLEAVTGEAVRDYMVENLSKQYEQLQKLKEDNARLLADLSGDRKATVTYTFSADIIKKAALKDLNALYDKESAAQQQATQTLLDENKKLGKELSEFKKQQAMGDSKVNKEMIGDITFMGKAFNGLDPKELRTIAEGYLKEAAHGIAAVATNVEGKASVVIAISKPLAEKISAVTLVQAAVAELGGKGGGGRPEMAQGGGPDGDKLDAALAKVKSLVA